jgi:hypothetical protein
MDILTRAGYNTKDAIIIDKLELTGYGVGIAVEQGFRTKEIESL